MLGINGSADSGRVQIIGGRRNSWQPVGADDLPACINALAVLSPSAPDRSMLVGTEAGLYESKNGSRAWRQVAPLPDVICLAHKNHLALAGSAEAGVYRSQDSVTWQPAAELRGRALVGLELSPTFDRDGTVFTFGPAEGLWRSGDGCTTWQALPAPAFA